VIELGDETNEEKFRATRRDSEKDAAHHARPIHCATAESCQDASDSLFEKGFSIGLREILLVAGGSGVAWLGDRVRG
jgi:hypothetical protein